jgi:flagellar hook assembly protein FlgD
LNKVFAYKIQNNNLKTINLMKTKLLQSLLLTALFISPFLFSNTSQAQTTGNLSVSFGTTFTGGSYGTKYLLAAWIETSGGTFIKTKLRYAKSSNLDHLATWTGKSGGSVVDAISSTTRPAPETLTFTWNGTDVSTAVVTDGTYKVWLEMAWGSSLTTGKTVQSFSFTKGVAADHQTGATTNFTGVTLDWVPTFVGIADNQPKETFSITPNPVNSQSTINYSLNELSDVTVGLYDVSGKLVKVLCDENQAAGNHNLPLSLSASVKPGIYFVKMNTGKTQHTQRILVSQ